ncbi:MAG: hypothetical protein NTX72_04890 [Candidatus Uhrbacteria bacterium]|nr:hypothetical protein [Candidatus Uhrbacteria bacterium]
MDWFVIGLLGLLGLLVLAVVVAGIYHLINTVSVELEVADAVVVNHDFKPAHQEFDYTWFAATKMWRYKTVPAEWHLLLEVNGEQDWIGVTEGTYRHKNGNILRVWLGRGRLNGKMFITDFYSQPAH